MTSGEPFAFAGLWESWQDPAGDMVRSCTIITTEPNELLRPIHNRMPVILPKELESSWLDDEVQDPLSLGDIFIPYPAEAMRAYEVSSLVNRPSNDGPGSGCPCRARRSFIREGPSSTGDVSARKRCTGHLTQHQFLPTSGISTSIRVSD